MDRIEKELELARRLDKLAERAGIKKATSWEEISYIDSVLCFEIPLWSDGLTTTVKRRIWS